MNRSVADMFGVERRRSVDSEKAVRTATFSDFSLLVGV